MAPLLFMAGILAIREVSHYLRGAYSSMEERELLERLSSGGEAANPAWKEFLRKYSNLFLKVIWQFEHDADEAMERYALICEKLADNNFQILRKFNPENQPRTPKFSTWLTIVVKNLCVDAFRLSHGRRRFPRSLERLSEFDRQVFALRYWKGYSVDEIESEVLSRTNNQHVSVGNSLSRIESAIAGSSRQYLARGPTFVPYEDGKEAVSVIEEPKNLDFELWFEKSLTRLSQQQRIVIRLRFWEGLTPREIADFLNVPPNRIHSLLHKALHKLRKRSTQLRK